MGQEIGGDFTDHARSSGERTPLLSRGGVAARSKKGAIATAAAQTGWCGLGTDLSLSRLFGLGTDLSLSRLFTTPPRPLQQGCFAMFS